MEKYEAKKVGITGGIGSGKTTVCSIFESIGIPVYYADDRAKKIMSSNKDVKLKIKNLLGESSYYSNGKPNRPFIASKVFSEPTLLEKLNLIVHPAVHDDFNHFFNQHKTKVPYVINEAALLIENGSHNRFDVMIVVTCPENIRIERVMKRDKTTREAVIKRLQNQMSEDEKVKFADYIIDNSGSKTLIPQVWEIHNLLLNC